MPSSLPLKILSIDVESNALHGRGFAVGAVVDEPGKPEKTFFAQCAIRGPVDRWVGENVLPALADEPLTHRGGRAMRTTFWNWFKENEPGALVVADWGWPVEANFLSACVADDPARGQCGPYPLHEVATLLAAAGHDPMASYASELFSPEELARHRRHHPVHDARLSARCARYALASMPNFYPPRCP